MTDIPANALIVVVEDDVFERMGASSMFLDAGYRVLEAGDADEALRFRHKRGHQAAFHGRKHARIDERVRFGPSCCRAMAQGRHHYGVGPATTSQAPVEHAIP